MKNITENTRSYFHELSVNFSSSQSVDMTETLFYQTAAEVIMDQGSNEGTFEASFFLSDLITKFKISANSFGKNGALGFQSKSIQTEK